MYISENKMSGGNKQPSTEEIQRSLDHYCDWLALACPQLVRVLAVSLTTTVVHQLALKPSLWNHIAIFCEDAQVNFTVPGLIIFVL